MVKAFDNPMTVKEAIAGRRSIRKFKPDPVPEEMLREMLEAARLAPSGTNRQPWRFIMVRNAETRKRLRDCCYGMRFVEEAPCIFVCCADLTAYMDGSTRRRLKELLRAGVFDDIGQLEGVPPSYMSGAMDVEQFASDAEMNCAIAVTHMVLTATSLGLGTCWVGLTECERVHRLFKLLSTLRVVVLLAVGFPDQDPPPRPRLPLEEIVLEPGETADFSPPISQPAS